MRRKPQWQQWKEWLRKWLGRKPSREATGNIVELAGFASFFLGLWLLSPVAMFMTLGVALFVGAEYKTSGKGDAS